MGGESKTYQVEKVTVAPLTTDPPGYEVTAFGTVRTGGWKGARLSAAVYVTPPSDGIQDLDFLPEKPDGIVTQANHPVTSLPLEITPKPWLKGFRVRAETNAIVKPI